MKSGLVLGGGAALGLSHIGVLQVLEREGYPIDLITGTSMGGLIGGLYALAGSTARLIEYQNEPLDNRRATDVSRAPRAEMLESRRYRAWLRRLFADKTFADLHWPLAVTAVDIDSGEELAFNRGPVAPAIWATTAIPGVYAPVKIRGRLVVDGGVLNPVPVDLAKRLGATVTLAIDVLPDKTVPAPRLPQPFHRAMLGKFGVSMGLLSKSFDIMLSAQRDYRLRDTPPDLLIRPDLAGFDTRDYHRAEELVAVGVAAAEAVLPQIRALRDEIRAGQERGLHYYQPATLVPATMETV
jgi:NTE family protein